MNSEPCVEIDLEALIERAAQLLHSAPTTQAKREAWILLARLHRLRTPRSVARMEAQRGLCSP